MNLTGRVGQFCAVAGAVAPSNRASNRVKRGKAMRQSRTVHGFAPGMASAAKASVPIPKSHHCAAHSFANFGIEGH